MKILFVYPRFERHADVHPELLDCVPMNGYLGSPSLGIAALAALTPPDWEIEFRDDRVEPADTPTDADLVALSFFTPAASRGLELARHFRGEGHTVVAGGIFPTMMPDEVQPHVDAVVVGEGEASWARVLEDVVQGRLEPRYSPVGPVDLSSVPVPDLSVYFDAEDFRYRPDDYPLQVSRGCPLGCRACVLPTSMTSQLRTFPLEHVVAQLRQLADADKRACLTEDTSWFPMGGARTRLEELFDHVIEHGSRSKISYVGTSMPMILMTPSRLLEKAKRAGVDMFYLVGGFDPVTVNAFTGSDPRALQRAIDAVTKARDHGIEPYTSFLVGGDQDDAGVFDRMLDFAETAGVRKAEFAIATPYPGTPHWRQVVAEGRLLTREWSRFNDANVTFLPAQMTPEQLTDGYLRLWRDFYADKQHFLDEEYESRTIQF